MKKILKFLLISISVFGLSACSLNKTQDSSAPDTTIEKESETKSGNEKVDLENAINQFNQTSQNLEETTEALLIDETQLDEVNL